MEAIVVPIVSAVSALLGVALSAYVQSRAQRAGQRFQFEAEAAKHERERLAREREEALQRLMQSHKMLSKLAREFSITNLDILWRSRMTDAEYDVRYFAACTEMDELRAIIGLHEPRLANDVEQIHGQMNIFWGSFKNVLYQTEKGQKVDHTSSSLANAHAAANEIGKKTAFLKERLSQRVEEVLNGG